MVALGKWPGRWPCGQTGMQKISAGEWREVFALLDAALEMPVADRAAWLATLDRQPPVVVSTLRDLLTRQTADRFKLPQVTGSPDWPPDAAAADTLGAGRIVGPYRLGGMRGRGGWGSAASR